MEENVNKETPFVSQENSTPLEEPKCLHHFSVGAFFLNWIWGICNSVWLSLLCLIPYAGFIMAIILGIKGNEWAWKEQKGNVTAEQFDKKQAKWAKAGWIVFGIGIVISIIIFFVYCYAIGEMYNY